MIPQTAEKVKEKKHGQQSAESAKKAPDRAEALI